MEGWQYWAKSIKAYSHPTKKQGANKRHVQDAVDVDHHDFEDHVTQPSDVDHHVPVFGGI